MVATFSDPNNEDALRCVAGDGDLGAGSYIVTLMQYNNFANGPDLSDGFEQEPGRATFTAGEWPAAQSMFCDSDGNQRNGNWALDILNVNAATPVPLPAALPLFAFGVAAVGFAARRRGPRS